MNYLTTVIRLMVLFTGEQPTTALSKKGKGGGRYLLGSEAGLTILSTTAHTYWPSVYVWKKTYLNTCPFFNWVIFIALNSENPLYILGLNPLSKKGLANICSHSVGCSFHFFDDTPFEIAKFLVLMKPNLSILSSAASALSVIYKKPRTNPRLQKHLLLLVL